MSDQPGLTIDTGVVDNGEIDEGDDEGGEDNGDNPTPPSKDPVSPIVRAIDDEMPTDRSEYTIVRPEDDPFGNPLHIAYENGESVEFVYNNDGGLMSVIDTSSGTRMINTNDGWFLEDQKGERTKIDGEVSVDSATGAVTTKLNDGKTIVANPDGRVVATDAKGQLIAVSNSADAYSFNNPAMGGRIGFHNAEFDDSGNLQSVSDNFGYQYRKSGEQWMRLNRDGTVAIIDGEVQVDNYGLTIVGDEQKLEPVGGAASMPS